jgi:hypothetical protein
MMPGTLIGTACLPANGKTPCCTNNHLPAEVRCTAARPRRFIKCDDDPANTTSLPAEQFDGARDVCARAEYGCESSVAGKLHREPTKIRGFCTGNAVVVEKFLYLLGESLVVVTSTDGTPRYRPQGRISWKRRYVT